MDSMNDVSRESVILALKGFRILGDLMRREGFFEFNRYGEATPRSVELFNEATQIWLRLYKEYNKGCGVWRKSRQTRCQEVSRLVITIIKKHYGFALRPYGIFRKSLKNTR